MITVWPMSVRLHFTWCQSLRASLIQRFISQIYISEPNIQSCLAYQRVKSWRISLLVLQVAGWFRRASRAENSAEECVIQADGIPFSHSPLLCGRFSRVLTENLNCSTAQWLDSVAVPIIFPMCTMNSDEQVIARGLHRIVLHVRLLSQRLRPQIAKNLWCGQLSSTARTNTSSIISEESLSSNVSSELNNTAAHSHLPQVPYLYLSRFESGIRLSQPLIYLDQLTTTDMTDVRSNFPISACKQPKTNSHLWPSFIRVPWKVVLVSVALFRFFI